VPVHYDPNHHFLIQIRGSKTVGTGTFSNPRVQQLQIERGMQTDRLRADRHPDQYEERVLHAGQALVIPAWVFHWVHGGDDMSIAVACVVATETTTREAAVHRFNASTDEPSVSSRSR
jgi:ribosomal protein L16 Arg81 hydroxylase